MLHKFISRYKIYSTRYTSFRKVKPRNGGGIKIPDARPIQINLDESVSSSREMAEENEDKNMLDRIISRYKI